MFNKIALLLILVIIQLGCSGSSPTGVNSEDNQTQVESTGIPQGHHLWGLWTICVNADGSDFDVIPIRYSQLHLNAIKFLEPPANNLLTIESVFVLYDYLYVDIGLRHPFPGHTEFTGFDVKGIAILQGSETRCTSDFLTFPSVDEMRLINADGYTRWWNPYEFPLEEGVKPVFSYIDGLLGTPYETAQFASTLNGYKYFADCLELQGGAWTIDPATRGMFGSGSYNRRRYKFSITGAQIVFNYAVDASWAIPSQIPPINILEDFPLKANQAEPYAFQVEETNNTLYNNGAWGGGDYELDVTIYTWRPLDSVEHVSMEIPGAFGPVGKQVPDETGDGWAKYSLRAHGAAPQQNGELQVLIRAACTPWTEYNGRLNGTPLSGFFIHRTAAATQPYGGTPGSIKGFRFAEPTMYENMYTDTGPGTYGAADVRDGYIGVLTGGGDDQPYDVFLLESIDGGNSFEPQAIPNLYIYSGNMLYGPNGSVHVVDRLNYAYRPDGLSGFTEYSLPFDEAMINFARYGIELDEVSGRLHIFCVSDDRKHISHAYTDDYENFSEPSIVITSPYSGFSHFSSHVGLKSHLFEDGSFGFLTIEFSVEGSDTFSHVYYRSGQLDDLGTPIQVDSGLPAADKMFPEFVVDSSGTIHTAWLDASPHVDSQYDTDWGNQVYYSRSLDGFSFSQPLRLTYTGGRPHKISALDMDINGAGQPVIAFAEFSDNPSAILGPHHNRLRIRVITLEDNGVDPTAPVDIFAFLPEPGYKPTAGIEDFSLTCVDNKGFIFWQYMNDLFSSPIEWSYY